VFLGYFTDEVDAARAYDLTALEHFGEFASLNFPPKKPAVSETAANRPGVSGRKRSNQL